MLRADGSTLYIDKDKILKPWEDHFDNVLNHTSSISDADITHLLQADTNMTLSQIINDNEVTKSRDKLLNGTAPGADAIPAEFFKIGGRKLIAKLTA